MASCNITGVTFSPDSRTFAVGSFDGTTTLWDLRSRKPLGNAFPHALESAPLPLFEANGRLLIVELSNATEWPTDRRTWERVAWKVAGRDIRRDEWSDVLPDREYKPVCPR